jgi:inner membrane protein
MPTIVTHGFIAALLGNSLAVGRVPPRFWILSALCSILPDTDVLGFPLGIRYQDMLGHRGLTHSLIFALALGWIVTFLAFPRLPRTRFLLFFLLLHCDSIAWRSGRDDRWRPRHRIFRAIR